MGETAETGAILGQKKEETEEENAAGQLRSPIGEESEKDRQSSKVSHSENQAVESEEL